MRHRHQKNGFSLIETLVAITVLVFGIVGPLTLAQIGLRSFSQIRDRIVAEYLAQEGLEIVRNIRDTALIQDPASGLPQFTPCQSAVGCYVDATSNSPALTNCTGTGCPPLRYDRATGEYNYSTGVNTIFTRAIFVSPGNLNTSEANGEEALVTSRVTWPSRLVGTETVEFTGYLTDWFRF